MAIVSKISDASPSELLYFLAHFKKTGSLQIKNKEKNGKIFIKDGKIVHSFFENEVGIEALYSLSLLQEGEEIFTCDEAPPSETIAEESLHLISEAERRRSELSELIRKVPPLETILVRTTRLNSTEPVVLRKSDWKVFVLTDGKTNLNNIIKISKIGVLDIYSSISWLLQKKYILDPAAALRDLKYNLLKLNELLKIYGDGGIGISSWIDFLKEQIKKFDPDNSKTGKYLRWDEEKLNLEEKSINPKNATLIKDFIQRLSGLILEKAQNEYGKIIAKRKFDQVKKKLASIEVV